MVDELVQNALLKIYKARIALSVFANRPASLEEFIQKSARRCVRAYFARRTRRRKHEVPVTESQIEQLKAEWDDLDQVTIEEFRLLLTAAEDRVFYQILLGNRDKPPGRPPLTANERRLLAQIRAKWATFRAES